MGSRRQVTRWTALIPLSPDVAQNLQDYRYVVGRLQPGIGHAETGAVRVPDRGPDQVPIDGIQEVAVRPGAGSDDPEVEAQVGIPLGELLDDARRTPDAEVPVAPEDEVTGISRVQAY
jgi:hypothetical protein